MRQACYALVALTSLFSLSARPGDPPTSSRVGTKIADIRLKDTRGQTVTLADQKGKAVVVVFTGTQCPPCVGVDLAPYPNVLAYRKRVGARPAVQTALQAEGLTKAA